MGANQTGVPVTESPVKRRGWLFGVGAAGAAVVAAKLLPGAVPAASAVPAAKAVVDTATGYRLTPHIQSYYDSAKS